MSYKYNEAYLCDQCVTGLIKGRVIVCKRVDGHEEHRHDRLSRRGHWIQYGVVDAFWCQWVVVRQKNHIVCCEEKFNLMF